MINRDLGPLLSQEGKNILHGKAMSVPASNASNTGISSIKRGFDAMTLDDDPSTKALTPPSRKQKIQPALDENSFIRGGLGDTSSWAHRSLATFKHELPYLREDCGRMHFGVDFDMLVGQRVKQNLDVFFVLCEHAQRYIEARNEAALYPPFQDFANELFRSAELPFRFIHPLRLRPDGGPHGSSPKRRPSVVMIHKDPITPEDCLATIDVSWSKAVLCVEFNYNTGKMRHGVAQKKFRSQKSKPGRRSRFETYRNSMRSEMAKFSTRDAPQQQEELAAHALEMFSASCVRRHVLGLYVDSPSVEFWYYDRSAGYGSAPLSFANAWEPLAILLLAIGIASAEQLGFEPIIKPPGPPDSKPGSQSSMPITAKGARIQVDGNEYVIEGTLGKLRSLIGRGTTVFTVKEMLANAGQASVSDSASERLVLKLSWQLKDRRSEVDILRRLHEREVPGVPFVVCSDDLARMRDGIHGKVQEIMGLDADTDDRIYRAIIMKPLLTHLTAIGDWTTFFTLFKGLIKARILHRDINPTNLMVRKEPSGELVPFLIDYDFAIVVPLIKDEDNRIRTHRTMATPFLAIELLSDAPPPAIYRYDLESFFWSLWWIAHSYLNGQQIKTEGLCSWYSGTWRNIHTAKGGYMSAEAVQSTKLTKNMEHARPVLRRLAELFQQAFHNVQKAGRMGRDVGNTWSMFRCRHNRWLVMHT
ncbi:uncharacterized protein EI90DRAFT_2290371 [Cantharellus anzutake]|uniref:uncharacterized protein n=1 Tax=Cantharellus anzutake TaxID=1750568 RepID=UPI001906D85F|nr:uncharacterized protein EI90DRAFT_2290371 [Cantharellus anzutake]KAF8339834.1 hypothetical protein EI90DRAFT_2290371 [Cantharellus anzutake]